MRHILSILVENEAGALSRISGLFSARGDNIESLTVAPTEDPTLSRMTIVTVGSDDVVVTVATDGAAMYHSERDLALAKYFPAGFDEVAAGEVYGEHLLGAATDHLRELTHEERERIFNLGYYTWVEQQGVSLADFEARRSQTFWEQTREQAAGWDVLIDELNARTGVLEGL